MTFKVIVIGNHKPSAEQLTEESKRQLLKACGLHGHFDDVEFIEATHYMIQYLPWIKNILGDASRDQFKRAAEHVIEKVNVLAVQEDNQVGLWFEGHSLLAQDLALYQEKNRGRGHIKGIYLLKAHSERVSFEVEEDGKMVKKSEFRHAKWFCV